MIMKKLFLLLTVCLMAGTTHVFGQTEKEYDKENYLYATEVKAEAGNKVVIPLSLKNTEKIGGMQFDLYMDDVFSLYYTEKNNKKVYSVKLEGTRSDSDFHSTTITDKTDHFFVISTPTDAGNIYDGTDGVVYNITLTVSAEAPTGEYYAYIKNINLANTNGLTTYYPEDVKCKVSVTNATGINGITASENADVYNANGQKQNKVRKGFNIVRKNDGTTVKVVK